MNGRLFTIGFLVLFVITGCPGRTYKSDLKKIQENNMDLPLPSKSFFNGIQYRISGLFRDNYNNDYVLSNNASTKSIYDIDLNFSVESFSSSEAEAYAFLFEGEISKLDAVHDNYIKKRSESLKEFNISIKKELPKTVKYPGYIQIIHGSSNSYSENASYFTATMEIEDEYFVFQLIGKEENMGYLYDDFIEILNSVTK